MKRMMSIAAVALFVAGSTVFAGEDCKDTKAKCSKAAYSEAEKAECKKDSKKCMKDSKKCGADCKKACCAPKAAK